MITSKKPDEHHDEDEHSHAASEIKKSSDKNTTNFERIEVVKGVSNVGYTAITPISNLPSNAQIITKGAFFVNAKLTNQGEAHSH